MGHCVPGTVQFKTLRLLGKVEFGACIRLVQRAFGNDFTGTKNSNTFSSIQLVPMSDCDPRSQPNLLAQFYLHQHDSQYKFHNDYPGTKNQTDSPSIQLFPMSERDPRSQPDLSSNPVSLSERYIIRPWTQTSEFQSNVYKSQNLYIISPYYH